MNELIEMKWVLLLAIQYAISFFGFGYIYATWRAEDEANNLERFWLIKHYWKKILASQPEKG